MRSESVETRTTDEIKKSSSTKRQDSRFGRSVALKLRRDGKSREKILAIREPYVAS